MSTIDLNSRTNWANVIDNWARVFKWPAAWLAVALTPLFLWALLCLTLRVVFNPLPLLPFALGTVAFIILWRRWLGKSRTGRFLLTLEHESTHALFALLTLHRIVGFRASVGRGGEIKFVPHQGNWLITVAPYFFPTAAMLLFGIAYLLPFPGLPWQSFLLGIALGYHLVSTLRETHRDQTDIQTLGSLFCWMFLPTANLAVIGLLISFAHAGSAGLSQWVADVWQPVQAIYAYVTQLNVTHWLSPAADASES